MAQQRERERERSNRPQRGERPSGVTKQRKGFSVGRSLPDGPQLRRVQQVKRGLIENAKLKKQYAKVKGRTQGPRTADNNNREGKNSEGSPSLVNDRSAQRGAAHEDSEADWSDEDQDVLPRDQQNSAPAAVEKLGSKEDVPERRFKRPKPQPFQRQEREAERRKREIEERQEAREKADAERKHKIEERERFRKAMAKARTGGKNGQRKLGRESAVLLEKVQRMIT
jgi:hypothetical protein